MEKVLDVKNGSTGCERMVAETPEREARLERMSTSQCKRLAVETPQERGTRLQLMRDRLAAETPKEKETRLWQMSTNQNERLAVETCSNCAVSPATVHHRPEVHLQLPLS